MRSYNFCQIECALFWLEMQWKICYYKPKLRGLGKGGKMKRIVLICMSGLSTNLLVNKMKRTAKERGIEAEICAMSELAFTRLWQTDGRFASRTAGFVFGWKR